jgi:hypothetical protein
VTQAASYPALYQGYGVPFDGQDDDERTRRSAQRKKQARRTQKRTGRKK